MGANPVKVGRPDAREHCEDGVSGAARFATNAVNHIALDVSHLVRLDA